MTRRRQNGGGRHGLKSLRSDIGGEFLLGIIEFDLDLPEPVLKDGDETHATIDRVTETGFGFVGQRLHGVVTLGGVELVQKLRDIACPENPVDVSEPLRIVRWEVRREHAFLRAFPPKELARSARRIRR